MKSSTLPQEILPFSWGDSLQELNWQDHQQYIAQTILEKGDANAAKWLLSQTSKQDLLAALPQLKLSPKSHNFWALYLS